VADAACGSFEILEELEGKGFYGTFSCSSISKPWPWNQLRLGTSAGLGKQFKSIQ